jgi:hypothetical protein
MAILDANLVLADAQAITATAISENVIAVPARGTVPYESAPMGIQWGAGTPLPMLAQVVEDFDNLTSLKVSLETSDNADLSASTVLAETGAIPLADLIAGKQLGFNYFPSIQLSDYVGMRFTVTGTNPSQGKVTVAIGSTVGAGHVE